MTDDQSTPADDDAAHWGPIVAQRLADYKAVLKFIRENSRSIPLAERFVIKAAGDKVLREQAKGADVVRYGFGEFPNTGAAAGMLRQARHVMVKSIIALCPDVAENIPREGEAPPELGNEGRANS